jgi:glycosyltransferase involved in cell wall biosynthesis
MITALIWGFPYSITIHGPDEFFDQKESALAQKIHCAKFIICISDFSRSQIMRLTPPTHWNKFHIVRLGIDPSLAEQPLPELRRGNLRILCTGRLVGAKGQAILLLAVTELLRRGHLLQLTLIGDGPHRPELQRMVEEKNIADHVIFAGAQNHDRVLETLRSTDIFVLPSFAEGVPVALMEAMAIGVPCVSTFVAGIPELIRHEQDGLLVPPGSASELTDAIERLITDPAERDRLRSSARQRVLEHYNLPVNLRLLAETFALYLPAESSSA